MTAEIDVKIYNVTLVYDTFSIVTTVDGQDEDIAIDNAIDLLKDELGASVESYNYIEVQDVDY